MLNKLTTIKHNPYAGIDWDTCQQYQGDFHQHSTECDGQYPIPILLDDMVHRNRSIACITGHDSLWLNRGKYPKVLATDDPENPNYRSDRPNGRYIRHWPFSEYDGDVYYDPAEEGNYTELAREGTIGEFDVDENGVMPNGLLAVEAREISEVHHINALFSDYDGFPGDYTEESVFTDVEETGGISFLCHPHWYWQTGVGPFQYSTEWYRYIFDQYQPIGIEIRPGDLENRNNEVLWDLLMTLTGKTFWGFSNSDSHLLPTWGRYNNVIMPSLTLDNLKTALVNGCFFACEKPLPPEIHSVVTTDTTITINAENYDRIEWISGLEGDVERAITGNFAQGSVQAVLEGNSRVVGLGKTFNYSTFRRPYVRARLFKEDRITFVNPISFEFRRGLIHQPNVAVRPKTIV